MKTLYAFKNINPITRNPEPDSFHILISEYHEDLNKEKNTSGSWEDFASSLSAVSTDGQKYLITKNRYGAASVAMVEQDFIDFARRCCNF